MHASLRYEITYYLAQTILSDLIFLISSFKLKEFFTHICLDQLIHLFLKIEAQRIVSLFICTDTHPSAQARGVCCYFVF